MILKGGPYPGLEVDDADAVICSDEAGVEHVYDEGGDYLGRLVWFGGSPFIAFEVDSCHRAVPSASLKAVECLRR